MRRSAIIAFLLIVFLSVGYGAAGENTSPGRAAGTADGGAPAAVDDTDPASRMTDIHDIKPPQKDTALPAWLLYGAAALGAAGLLAGLVYYARRRRRRRLDTIVATVSPEEVANRLLGKLSSGEGLAAKDFYFRLSAILRGYIKDRFGLHATEMTTEEFLPRLDELRIDPALQKGVKKLAVAADPIKFAGARGSESRMAEDLCFVKTFVRSTTPSLQTPADAAEGSADGRTPAPIETGDD